MDKALNIKSHTVSGSEFIAIRTHKHIKMSIDHILALWRDPTMIIGIIGAFLVSTANWINENLSPVLSVLGLMIGLVMAALGIWEKYLSIKKQNLAIRKAEEEEREKQERDALGI